LEKVFVAGLIPPPRQPTVTTIQSVLCPLVEELSRLYNPGVNIQTSDFPDGTLIRVAIFPVLADREAVPKLIGFGQGRR
jgi:hypothetical protein